MEIAFWQSIDSFDFGEAYDSLNLSLEPSEFDRQRLIGLTHELSGQVGSIYAGAVRECLRIEMNCPNEQVEGILCWKVAAALDQCMA